jgi:hypothetical protein
MTNINPIHVSAPEYHLQGLFQIKVIQAKHANLGTASPLYELLASRDCITLI